jgi:hypothetical protein
VRKGGAQEYCIDKVASVMTMTTTGVGGVLIEDLGVSPDRWGGYNVTQWGHLRVRFGDDGSGQMGFKIETKNGGSRNYWSTVTDVYKRGDGAVGPLIGVLLNPEPVPIRCACCPFPLRRPSLRDARAALVCRRGLPVRRPSPPPTFTPPPPPPPPPPQTSLIFLTRAVCCRALLPSASGATRRSLCPYS